MFKKINLDEVKSYIESKGPNTKIYLGGDSERIRVKDTWYAEYYTVVIIHIDGKHGCKVFGEISREKDYDQKKSRPRMRLMTEVMKVAELYIKLADILDDREVEIHLDINPDEKHGSNCVISEAVGYIKGMCNITPFVKPKSWAATSAADRFKDIKAA